MSQEKKNDGFIMQAGILAITGILVRVIGILYRAPLTGIIGDEGNGYYTSAYNIYTIILLISSYSIPSAISKVIAQRLALREYRNAHKIFRCSILYVFIVGGVASLVAFLLRPGLWRRIPRSYFVCLRRLSFYPVFRCTSRLFPGASDNAADILFSDHRADLKCSGQSWSCLSADQNCFRKG